MKLATLVAIVLGVVNIASAQTAQQLLDSAKAAYQRGNVAEAIAMMDRAVEAAPDDPGIRYARASLLENQRLFDRAIADYTKLVSLDDDDPSLYNRRGAVRFKAGQIEGSIEDFDRAIALEPASEPHHWQRGISYYYAGRFADGARQFERHRTVNAHDVENAVWHFMCVARDKGLAAAKASLIPINTEFDDRVPMKQIYDLFSGSMGSVEQVLRAAEAGDVTEALRRNHRFYAHLYLGLWYEAQGSPAKAREHMQFAAHTYGVDHYMGEVAKVHLSRMPPAVLSGPRPATK